MAKPSCQYHLNYDIRWLASFFRLQIGSWALKIQGGHEGSGTLRCRTCRSWTPTLRCNAQIAREFANKWFMVSICCRNAKRVAGKALPVKLLHRISQSMTQGGRWCSLHLAMACFQLDFLQKSLKKNHPWIMPLQDLSLVSYEAKSFVRESCRSRGGCPYLVWLPGGSQSANSRSNASVAF